MISHRFLVLFAIFYVQKYQSPKYYMLSPRVPLRKGSCRFNCCFQSARVSPKVLLRLEFLAAHPILNIGFPNGPGVRYRNFFIPWVVKNPKISSWEVKACLPWANFWRFFQPLGWRNFHTWNQPIQKSYIFGAFLFCQGFSLFIN